MDGYGLAMLAHIIGTVLLFGGLALTTAALLAMARAQTSGGIRRWATVAGRVDKLPAVGAGISSYPGSTWHSHSGDGALPGSILPSRCSCS